MKGQTIVPSHGGVKVPWPPLSSASNRRCFRFRKRVSWNEANIEEIEANKPERKKIDEPKTPYPSMIEQDGSFAKSIDFAAHAEALKNALNKLALSENHDSTFRGWTSSDDEGETGRDEDQAGLAEQRVVVSFEDKRRAHYDEFKKAKELQEKACFLDDEYDNEMHISGSCSTLGIDLIEIDIEDCDEILQMIDIEEPW